MPLLKFVVLQKLPQTLIDFLLTKLQRFNFNSQMFQTAIQRCQIKIDGVVINNLTYDLKFKSVVEIFFPHWPQPLKANSIVIEYIDQALIVVQKPYGITTHNDAHHNENTVEVQVRNYVNFPPGTLHPGIIHRLDKVTSGLLIVARNLKAYQILKRMMMKRDIKRYYFALVEGVVENNRFVVNAPINKTSFQRHVSISALGKIAWTSFEVKLRLAKHTLLKCQLKTGRTHQIRVHLQYVKHPIVNDTLYQKQTFSLPWIFLHAGSLIFPHPFFKTETYHFSVPLPNNFVSFILNNI